MLLPRVGAVVTPLRIRASSFEVPDRNPLLMDVTAPPISIFVRLEQLAKAFEPMEEAFGRAICERAAHPWNMYEEMARSSGKDTVCKAEQYEKTPVLETD